MTRWDLGFGGWVLALVFASQALAALDPFVVTGPPLLVDPSSSSWTVGIAQLSRSVELPAGTWRASATLERTVEGVPPRLFLQSPDGVRVAGRGPSAVGAVRVTATLEDSRAGEGLLGVRIPGATTLTGVRFGAVEVAPAAPSAGWNVGWWATATWLGMGAAVAAVATIRAAGGRGVVLVSVAAGLGLGVLAPNDALDLWVAPASALDPRLPLALRKLGGHGLTFFVLGAAGRWAGGWTAQVVGRLGGLAVATEAAQRLVPDRSPRLEDLVLDLAGASCGCLLVAVVTARRGGPRAPRASSASRP